MEPFCSVGKKKDDQMSKMIPLCEHSHETGCTMYIKRKTVHYVASNSLKVMVYGPDSTIAVATLQSPSLLREGSHKKLRNNMDIVGKGGQRCSHTFYKNKVWTCAHCSLGAGGGGGHIIL